MARPVAGFFEVQRRQRRRTVALVIALGVFLMPFTYLVPLFAGLPERCTTTAGTSSCTPVWFDPVALVVTATLAVAFLALAVVVGARQAMPRGARLPSPDPREQRLVEIGAQMAIAAGIAPPRVLVLDDPALNAYATWDRGTPVVVVTSGLNAVLDNRQMTGVIAHETAHLANRDARVIWMATFTVGLVLILATSAAVIGAAAASTAQRSSGRNSKSASGGIAALALVLAAVLWLVALPAATLMRAVLSRRRELLADASAVQFTRDPGGLRAALERIAAGHAQPAALRRATAELWIRHPEATRARPGFIDRLWGTHPPLEERIAWLRGLEGANALWAELP